MAKIPKNLSDRDMWKDYHEEPTIEETFLRAEKKQVRRDKEEHPGKDIRIAYLTPDVVDALGKALLELKMALFKDGIVDYKIEVRREGKTIVLAPREKAGK